MQQRPVIGILGGMGPEATVDLMARVIAATPAADDVDHVHLLVDQNPQVPSRIKAVIEGTGESPAPVLAAMARGLEAAGSVALAMPCNTAHAYLAEIRAAVGVPVLDMLGLSAARLAATPGVRRVGLLASTAVRMLGLYDRALNEAGLEPVFPARQEAVMELIRAVKRGQTGPAERAALAAVAEELRAETDAVLIACTELSVIADAIAPGAPVLDAMDALAAEIVRLGAPGQAARAAE